MANFPKSKDLLNSCLVNGKNYFFRINHVLAEIKGRLINGKTEIIPIKEFSHVELKQWTEKEKIRTRGNESILNEHYNWLHYTANNIIHTDPI